MCLGSFFNVNMGLAANILLRQWCIVQRYSRSLTASSKRSCWLSPTPWRYSIFSNVSIRWYRLTTLRKRMKSTRNLDGLGFLLGCRRGGYSIFNQIYFIGTETVTDTIKCCLFWLKLSVSLLCANSYDEKRRRILKWCHGVEWRRRSSMEI